MAEMSKQEHVIQLVKEGTHTREEIKELVGATTASLANYLTTMSNIARFGGADICPMTDEKGKIVTASYEDVQAAKAARVGTRKTVAAKTPAERLEAAHKRATRCANALASAKERFANNDGSRELELRADLAQINAELADMELARAKELVDEDDSAAESPDTEAEVAPEAEAEAAPEADLM